MNDETLDQALASLGPAVAPAVDSASRDAVVRSAITDFDNQLIADLVANLRPRADVLRQYGLTESDVVARCRNPDWVNRYKELHALWNSNSNIRERIRAKAAYLLEDSLVPLFKIISGSGTQAAKLAAIEQLTKISTVAHVPKDEQPAGPGRQITINIGAGMAPVVVATETKDERTIIHAAPALNAR